MIAFQKYGQQHSKVVNKYLFYLGFLAFVGWVALIAIIIDNKAHKLVESPVFLNIVLHASAGIVFFLFIKKIIQSYMQMHLFTKENLFLVTTLARLIMLFSLVIEPAVHFSVSFVASSGDPDAELDIVTYLQHVNLVGFAAGYALHMVAAVFKVARDMEDESKFII
ncbi:hypothetical protein ISG33_09230 [Glaciecola sp. MH2013]|uniref:hypothetical protein n=1 Tax=Glaciecola sp. MH2013 TaxID=2785524 RepID=UPI00189D5E50|nr:hypothetical protein [Glaciecola sp. MH2013]MBF7073574.1 hypothetical protein [Glaciecola sp. MH2013]